MYIKEKSILNLVVSKCSVLASNFKRYYVIFRKVSKYFIHIVFGKVSYNMLVEKYVPIWGI